MKGLLIVLPILFLITFTIMLGGLPIFVKVGDAFYNMFQTETTPEARAQKLADEDFVRSVATGATKFDSLVASQPRAKLINTPLSSLVPSMEIGVKPVILVFDDGAKSQYQFIRPILDSFGFKATFFVSCNLVQPDVKTSEFYMTWREILELQQEGHDIQSHSMNHRELTRLSEEELEYEVGGSKECFQQHGVIATIFAAPYNAGWDNSTVINSIASHYELAKNGINSDSPMYLNCSGWDVSVTNQTDCKTYSDSGALNYASRYSIKTWTHNYYDSLYAGNQTKIIETFASAVNRAGTIGTDGDPISVVVLEYHGLQDINLATSTDQYFNTDPYIFYSEMKYLYDNGFVVLTMSDLEYDNERNILFIDSNALL